MIILVFSSPARLIGLLVDWFVMTRYLERFIQGRCDAIKLAAEAIKKAS